MKKINQSVIWGALVALVAVGPLWGATTKPFGTAPFSGAPGGYILHVQDRDIDRSWEVVNENITSTAIWGIIERSVPFTQMAKDTTLKITVAKDSAAYAGNKDTSRVTITGILHRHAGSATLPDTFRYFQKTFKVASGDTTTTDSTYHAFEQAWLDTADNSLVHVWSSAQSPTTDRLAQIGTGLLTEPVAHMFFGSEDSPMIEKIVYGIIDSSGSSVLDTLRWSQGGAWNRADTLLGKNDWDTSMVVPIAGLEKMSMVWGVTVVENSTGGGNYGLTITPQVSPDSVNWTSLATTFSQTSSATATALRYMIYARPDTQNTAASLYDQGLISSSRYLRWLTAYSANSYNGVVTYNATNETTIVTTKMARQYAPSAAGIRFELRMFPNMENAITYTDQYVVRDRAHVTPQTGEIVHEFPGGMMLPERCYIAIMGKGDEDNRQGYITLIGKRRARQ